MAGCHVVTAAGVPGGVVVAGVEREEGEGVGNVGAA